MLNNPFEVSRGAEAYEIIYRYLVEKELTYTGGCRAFYTPEDWKARGEKYGREGVLIVVYDGGDVAEAVKFGSPYYDELDRRLRESGFRIEECECWYSAVYDEWRQL
jgi:hypothetical protein